MLDDVCKVGCFMFSVLDIFSPFISAFIVPLNSSN